MKVRHNEGIAIHIGPEPCIVGREVRDEASVGERIGQPFSRESVLSQVPTSYPGRKATLTGASRKCPSDLAWSKNLACTDAPCAGTGRSHGRPMGNAPKVRIGKVRSRSR